MTRFAPKITKTAVKKILMIVSGEVVTRNEIFSLVNILSVDLTNELSYIPKEILLENSFTSTTEILTKCIQSRFCGVWLPTSVEDCHIIICHCCDQITVKINIWSGVICDDFSVSRLPVLVWLNCLTHLGFDLSHGVLSVFLQWWGSLGVSNNNYINLRNKRDKIQSYLRSL